MSALTMVLTAAMAIPGTGPEKVSGEIVEIQPLDLSGEWEGVWYSPAKPPREARYCNERLLVTINHRCTGEMNFVCVDEGHGKMHLAPVPWLRENRRALGIYRWDGGRIFLCYRTDGQRRPTSFQAGDSQFLLILHRVKPRK